MHRLVAALALAASAAQVPGPRDPRLPSAPRPQGGGYGEPQGATLASLALAPDACEGDHVIVKGRLDLLEPGRFWLLADGSDRALLLAAEGLAGVEFDRMIGAWVEVRGLCREIRPKEYVKGVDLDLIKYPDLPPLPAPDPARPRAAITVFTLTDKGGPGREGQGPQTAIIRTVLNDPPAFARVSVRVVGLFRGRNLFGDLPADSQRSPSDWVLKEDDTALWVTGKAPKGKGWSLDPTYKGDTSRWLAVEGRIEVVNGVAYLRASKVALARDPRTEAAEPQ
jgi:hypothetical protein